MAFLNKKEKTPVESQTDQPVRPGLKVAPEIGTVDQRGQQAEQTGTGGSTGSIQTVTPEQKKSNLDATNGVDLTLATIDAQKGLISHGAAWRFDSSKVSLPEGMKEDADFASRELAIQAYVSALKNGHGNTTTIDSSTNQADQSHA